MYSVLVVDDEKEIRNGLASQAPWKEWGFDRVYTADDGPGALESVARYPVDLIVTDIRMPLMSGLELIRELEQIGFDGGMIVISGYDDFQYAKEAFKLGVTDYLLKPVNLQELANAVKQTVEALQKRQQDRHREITMRQSMDEMLPRLREETLLELFDRPYRKGLEAKLEYRFGQLGLEWLPEQVFQLALYGIDDLKALTERKSDREKADLEAAVGGAIQDYLDEHAVEDSILVKTRQGLWICMYTHTDDLDCEAHSMGIAARVREAVSVSVSFGLSTECGGLERLYAMYQEAEAALVYRKVSWNPEAGVEAGMTPSVMKGAEILQSARAVAERLVAGSEEDIDRMMMGFPELAASWGVKRTSDLQHKSFEWLLGVFRQAQKLGWRETEWEQNVIFMWEDLERFDTFESLQQQLTQQLIRTSASIQQQFGGQNQIVLEAEKYISEHFCEPITLQSVADHVHVTPVWLSKLFKKVTGYNFLEYLTKSRLDKARELLKDLNLKVYHISEMVGYQDKVHFSRLFKKRFGLTPQEYRNSRVNTLDE
ncbi:response regulator [Paenibacillus koleovorans]|uniref:response regulator n=1 Tax=Paenibacillus koleovorans TaxID=121608 RepID=UPI0013E3267D|nr:response regulator [Paenibacillus koleovorans]